MGARSGWSWHNVPPGTEHAATTASGLEAAAAAPAGVGAAAVAAGELVELRPRGTERVLPLDMSAAPGAACRFHS